MATVHATSAETPTEETHRLPGDPCVIVIFGAAGDLTKRKLIPALYNLLANKLLPAEFSVVGVTSAEFSDEEFRSKLSSDIREFATAPVDGKEWDWFRQ